MFLRKKGIRMYFELESIASREPVDEVFFDEQHGIIAEMGSSDQSQLTSGPEKIINMSNIMSFDTEMFALSNYVFDLTIVFLRKEYSLIKVVGAGRTYGQLPAAAIGSITLI